MCAAAPVAADFRAGVFGGPVAIMNDFLKRTDADVFAKIDNDTVVPPGWLGECQSVMERCPELDLLGIEVFCTVAPASVERGYQPASYIGGIGLMRRRAFRSLPDPEGYFGFTAWQSRHEEVIKGWLDPALPVFLLDRLPIEPWRSLSAAYVDRGWQRKWGFYRPESKEHLWGWWLQTQAPSQ